MTPYLSGKKALLLDMNSTFMFGEDRFGENHDYSNFYHSLGGQLARQEITLRIEHAYQYLDVRYPLKKHHDAFPPPVENNGSR